MRHVENATAAPTAEREIIRMARLEESMGRLPRLPCKAGESAAAGMLSAYPRLRKLAWVIPCKDAIGTREPTP